MGGIKLNPCRGFGASLFMQVSLGTNLIFRKDTKLCAMCVRMEPCTKALNKYLLAGWLQITKHHYSNCVVLSAPSVPSFLGQGLQYVNSSLCGDFSESPVGAVK